MSSYKALNLTGFRGTYRPLTSSTITARQTRTFSLFGWSSDPAPAKSSQPSQSQSNSTVSPTQSSQDRVESQVHEPRDTPKATEPHHKTLKEMDDELKAKMAGISGDGGDAGVEFEDGQPVAMKRR